MGKPSISAEEGLAKLEKSEQLQALHRERETKFNALFEVAKLGSIASVDYNDIDTNKNIRDEGLDEADFQLLINSIKEHGILQNIVAELQECSKNVFKLVCLSGHRRLAALKRINNESELFKTDPSSIDDEDDLAKLRLERESARRVPCRVKLDYELASKWKINETQSRNLEAALSENLLRRDMHFFEKAKAFKQLMNTGLSAQEIERKFVEQASESVSVRTINRLIGLYEIIPPEGRDLVLKHKSLFPLRYMLENFWEHKNAKKRNGPTIVRMIEKRISKTQDPNTKKDEKGRKTSAAKLKKVESFISENKMSKKEKERVIQALEFVGYLKAGDFPRAVEKPCIP